jgi:hypothetical protein
MNSVPRFSPNAKIKVLSLASVINNGNLTLDNLKNYFTYDGFYLNQQGGTTGGSGLLDILKQRNFSLFKTVGLAQNITIEENFNTTAVYGVGNPTQPKLVPGNYGVNITIGKLNIDGRDTDSFITSSEYWYSSAVQRLTGAYGYAYYTYLAIKDTGKGSQERAKGVSIYAAMPVNNRKEINAQNPNIMSNVSMIGFKITYAELFEKIFEELESGVLL